MTRFRSQVREVVNRNTVVSLALEQGFNAFFPSMTGEWTSFCIARATACCARCNSRAAGRLIRST